MSRQLAGDSGRDFVNPEESGENPPTFALATEIDRAIDLSCRACGAMAMGTGLGFPVGASTPLRFAPPTSDVLVQGYGRMANALGNLVR